MTTRRLRNALCLLVIVLALTAGAAAPARAGDDPISDADATTTTAFDTGDQRIIPRPNSGHAPEDAGDRGGALQLTVLALIVVGVGFVGVKIFRETKQRVPR